MSPMSFINTHNCKIVTKKSQHYFFVYLKFYRNWVFLSSIFFNRVRKTRISVFLGLN